MFDGLKRLLGGSDAPSSALHNALAPLRAADTAVFDPAVLFDRAVGYVHGGRGPEIVHELEQRKQPLLDELFITPGRLQSWAWPSDDASARLKKIGLDKDKVERARDLFYASDATPAQFVRFGRLLAALSLDVNRTTAGVPLWLTALVNDVANTFPSDSWSKEVFSKRLPRWRPELIEALLEEDDVAPADRVTITFSALLPHFDARYDNLFAPHKLPGLPDYLARHGSELTIAQVSQWTALSRTDLMERAEENPAIAAALAAVIAASCVDSAKGVRTAALRALVVLPAATRAEVLPPVLAKVPASRAGELVDLLGRDDEGAALLQTAVDGGAKIKTLVDQASQRRDAISAEAVDETLELPPFEPYVETDNAEVIKAELRQTLAAEIKRGEGHPDKWVQQGVAKARSVTEADLEELVQAANGQRNKSKLLSRYSLWWLGNSAPSLNLVQVMRLGRIGDSRHLAGAARMRADSDTDLRVIADAATRAGWHDLDMGPLVTSGAISPEAAWPWLADHLDVIELWLTSSPERVTTALSVLACFPRQPQSLLPMVAVVALGESKTNRPLAQAALASHPAALTLAGQGLTDSKGEIRIAAAGWLASLGNPAGIPPLRAALKKETRELVRAAMLAALETLGDDISGDLAPTVLLAEAAKGLKAKPPASMAWLNLDLIPAARWADGTPVDPTILRWWHVLAVKLKEPDGSGLLDRYLSLLHPDDAADVGRFALRSWVAQDTRHPAEEDSRAHAATMGPQRWQSAQDWWARARTAKMNPEYQRSIEEQAAVPVETHTAQSYADHQAIYLGSAVADKGLLALTTRMPGIEVASATQAYIRNHGGRRSQVECLVTALYGNGDPAAVQLLLSISRRFKQATIQARALDFVERLAESRGWTPDEMADRTIPTAGFSDDRLLHLDYGPREFIGRVNAKAGIELADAEGKVLKALPNPRAGDDEELVAVAKKQLTASRKELKAVLDQQSSRLYEAMCTGRSWVASDWQEFLADHPLVSRLVAELIWVTDADGVQRLFRPTEDGELIGLDDEPITLASGDRVSLAHRVLMTADVADAWRTHLADYAVTPLFDQLSATLPAFAPGATALDDLRGHLTDTFSFRGVAGKRGYTRGGAEDGGWFTEYSKVFTSLGLAAVLEFTGSYLPEENITCATGTLRFRGRGSKPVTLAEVPPVLLAECYADYAALAALGPFDPDYEKKSEF